MEFSQIKYKELVKNTNARLTESVSHIFFFGFITTGGGLVASIPWNAIFSPAGHSSGTANGSTFALQPWK